MRKGTLEERRIRTAFPSDGVQVPETVDGRLVVRLGTAICSGK